MTDSYFSEVSKAIQLHHVNREHLQQVQAACQNLKHTYEKKNEEVAFLLKDFEVYCPDSHMEIDSPRYCSEEEQLLIETECQEQNIDSNLIIKSLYSHLSQDMDSISKPCLSVIGQTNSGKSSLINRLLGEHIVPQSERRLTGRLTYITYSAHNFVAQFDCDSTLRRLRIDQDKIELHSNDLDLDSAERNDESSVKVQIKLGVNNAILQTGIDLIDCPGLNENGCLNELCHSMTKSLLPLLVYVIDGRDGLKESDIRDIRNVKFETPELHIIYFVTKLDQTEFDKRRNRKRNPIKVAEQRMRKVFDKLKLCSFIAQAETIENCQYFHGCDLWTLTDIQTKNADPDSLSDYEQFCLNKFHHFQKDLVHFICFRLEKPLRLETKNIQMAIEQLLEKFMEKAWTILDNKRQKLNDIEEYREKELHLYEKEFVSLKESLKQEINNLVNEKEVNFLESLKSMNEDYRSSSQAPINLQDLHKEIKMSLEVAINTEVKYKIMEFMNNKEISLRSSLIELVNSLSEPLFGLTSFQTMLQNRLFHDYNCEMILENCFKPLKQCLHYELPHNDGALYLKSSPADFFERECRNILGSIDREAFVENVYRAVFDQFDRKHESFVRCLNDHQETLMKRFRQLDEFRHDLKKMAEEFAFQFMICLHIVTPYDLKIDPDFKRQPIGKGGQAIVYKVKLQNESYVAEKQYKKPIITVSQSDNRGCAEDYCPFIMEVYYSSRLNHSRVLKLKGLKITSTNESHQLSTYSPFMSEGDCLEYLKSSISLTELQKLDLAIQIAEGMEHIHSLKIIHRDIKLKNIFLQTNPKTNNPEAVVADYGLSKSFGFVDSSDHYFGTPLYMAPEIILDSVEYTEKVDVYSFAIVLWQVMSYTTTNAGCLSFQPKFVNDWMKCINETNDFPDILKSMIEREIADGARPEKIEPIDEKVWNLIENCWEEEARERPSFQDIVSELVRLRSGLAE